MPKGHTSVFSRELRREIILTEWFVGVGAGPSVYIKLAFFSWETYLECAGRGGDGNRGFVL